MALIHDFSDIDDANYKYAISLFLTDGFLFLHNNRFELSTDFTQRVQEEISCQYPWRFFWISLSLGIEILAKSVLIKHEIDIFTKKNNNSFGNGWMVKASNNSWLSNILTSKNIEYVNQLNTGTLGKLYNSSFRELKNNNIITPIELDQINCALKQLADERRNKDLHFYFKSNTFMNNNDLNDNYLPLINLLMEVYER